MKITPINAEITLFAIDSSRSRHLSKKHFVIESCQLRTVGESEHMRDQREEKRINVEQLETTKIGKGLVEIYFEEDTEHMAKWTKKNITPAVKVKVKLPRRTSNLQHLFLSRFPSNIGRRLNFNDVHITESANHAMYVSTEGQFSLLRKSESLGYNHIGECRNLVFLSIVDHVNHSEKNHSSRGNAFGDSHFQVAKPTTPSRVYMSSFPSQKKISDERKDYFVDPISSVPLCCDVGCTQRNENNFSKHLPIVNSFTVRTGPRDISLALFTDKAPPLLSKPTQTGLNESRLTEASQ
ncbi:hypothetical protein WN51_04426 [Melipona quadrifasciata]|uniref:Uncharacterized protein n=1 Tax=Melipona quadrifasciata TaxID=166423 RepID=A0A0M8ZUK7_9HYME|nr:hypothetical protein WN51_04426 [Melipona quadrifasciata]